jgi:hypothetical protein
LIAILTRAVTFNANGNYGIAASLLRGMGYFNIDAFAEELPNSERLSLTLRENSESFESANFGLPGAASRRRIRWESERCGGPAHSATARFAF